MKGVFIPEGEFIAEHKKLVKILRQGNKQEQKKEARKQYMELMKKMKK